MDKKEAQQTLSGLVKNVKDALTQAQMFADEHGLEFYFAPAYGMGGSYYGKAMREDPAQSDWVPSEAEDNDGWYSSSMSC
jgi:hypothetical protein